jgi:hypothetical protein
VQRRRHRLYVSFLTVSKKFRTQKIESAIVPPDLSYTPSTTRRRRRRRRGSLCRSISDDALAVFYLCRRAAAARGCDSSTRHLVVRKTAFAKKRRLVQKIKIKAYDVLLTGPDHAPVLCARGGDGGLLPAAEPPQQRGGQLAVLAARARAGKERFVTRARTLPALCRKT